ncbi:helix-turn-helix transcriptional regulator [Pullulanibacillus sp. KACC 23026]|uniref:helix-turn-helix domain-containing protein n=1 Tax=Pullulanibacillus sp. KACC 23026 TaxID=3028315 RepID=UPI0023AEC37A|nr:helix-turn-helix transcriptional regulator [Pullulanibacillus sp. KACC 23026]WEG13804.1 helix-turn-helix transcriptional regulator [Pullulanibacillus sp. KACC 23026]
MNIGMKIKFRRKELNLTQEEVCTGICSITYLSKLENNKIEANHELLKQLSVRLKMNLDDLLQDDFSHHMTQLRTLYKFVNEKSLSETNEKILAFPLNQVHDPIIRTGFDIILFLFTIRKNEKEKAIQLKDNLIGKETYLNEELMVWYYISTGLFEYTYGSIEKAVSNLYQAKEVVDQYHLIDAHLDYLLALANTRMNLISKSILHLEAAIKTYTNEMNFRKIIDCKILLAANYSKLGDYPMAREHLLKIVESIETTGNASQLGLIYHNLGYLYSLTDQPELSLSYFKKALDIKTDHEDKLNTIYLLANEYKKHGDLSKALSLCTEGINQSHKENKHYYYKLLILKQSILPDGYHDDHFLKFLENEIIPFFIEQDFTVTSECYYLLAKISTEKNHYKKAVHYYEEALKYAYKTTKRESPFSWKSSN